MALEKCCFCYKLENGAVIWGTLSILFAVCTFSIFYAVDSTSYSKPYVNSYSRSYPNSYSNSYSNSIQYSDKRYVVSHVSSSNGLYLAFRIMSIIQIITAILLIAGAVKRNHYMMLPWIVYNGIALIPLVPIAILGAFIAIPVYFPFYIWWCICSAYQRVQEDKVSGSQMVSIYTTSNLVGHPTPAHSLDQHSNTGYVQSAAMPSMTTNVTMPHNDIPPKYEA